MRRGHKSERGGVENRPRLVAVAVGVVVGVGVVVAVGVGVVVGVGVAVGVVVGVGVGVAVAVAVGVVVTEASGGLRGGKTLAAVLKLVALQREHLEKAAALAEEIDTLLGGGVGMGDLLKRLYAHFDTVWAVRYAHGTGGRYVWTYVKDAPQMKRLTKTLGVEELEHRMIAYLKNDDPYFVRARHSFGLFVASVNQHASEAAPAADLELSDDVAATRRRQKEMRG